MSRGDFGTWGVNLSDDDFACALAAAGVLLVRGWPLDYLDTIDSSDIAGYLRQSFLAEEEQPKATAQSIWAWDSRLEYHLEEVQYSYWPDELAQALADAWKELVVDVPYPRLALHHSTRRLPHFPWLLKQLERPIVGVGSVYVALEAATGPVYWDWPLRVAMLDHPASRRLLDSLGMPYWPHLSTIEMCTPDRDRYDILLLPWSLRESTVKILQLASPVRASLIVVFGNLVEVEQEWISLKETLLYETSAAGVCVIDVPKGSGVHWYNRLVEELSHNSSLDVALHNAASSVERPYFFFTSQQLLERSRLSKVAQGLVDRLRILPGDDTTEMPALMSWHFDEIVREYEPAHFAEFLQRGIDQFKYDNEVGDATTVANISNMARRVIEPAEAEALPPRWIQASVFEVNADSGWTAVQNALRADAPHLVDVFIGPADLETQSLIAPEAFPENELAPNEPEHILTVVFSEPNHAPEAQTATIVLPRQGRSSIARFYFNTLAEVPDFEARIIVLYENRILQTALLRGQAVSEPAEVTVDKPLELVIEAVVHPTFTGLEKRRHFDAAFVFDRSVNGEQRGTAVAGTQASLFPLGGIENFIKNIDTKLETIALNPEAFPDDLTTSETKDLLYFLASQGHELNKALEREIGRSILARIKGRIQIVSAQADEFVPLEFAYDYPAPHTNATLCSRAKEALEQGRCLECMDIEADTGPYVCPLGFWGMKCIIERFRNSKDAPLESPLKSRETRLLTTRVEGRDTVKPFKSAIFAASDKVADADQKQIMTELRKYLAGLAEQVHTWDEWVLTVNKQHPTLFVLLPHTLNDRRSGLPAMEIGAGDRKPSQLITKEYVGTENATVPPIVLLLGCETLSNDVEFQNLVSKFRDEGAAIVVGTRTSVRGRHLVPVVTEVLSILDNIIHDKQQPHSFGDVMLALRRNALADGYPVVLCLFAYGDADWKLAL